MTDETQGSGHRVASGEHVAIRGSDISKRLFLEKYFANGFNATQAYLTAFPQTKTRKAASVAASILMHEPDMAVAIVERRDAIAEAFNITAERTLGEVARIAYGRISDFMQVQDDGSIIWDFSAATEDQLAAIESIKTETYIEGEGDFAREVKRVEVKMHNKLAALDKLMKFQGIAGFGAQLEGEGEEGGDRTYNITLKIGDVPGQKLNFKPGDDGSLEITQSAESSEQAPTMVDITPAAADAATPQTISPQFGVAPKRDE